MNQAELADQGQQLAGFRLQRFEVFNWGTFHGRIWQLQPHGQTALLTGENGSGKSTLVDGLLTLLVPNAKRAYNQASGAGGKRERDERSYVLGAYGKIQREDEFGSQTQMLRSTKDYSVLLAYFSNQTSGRSITLAHFFWHQDGLQKFYVIATTELSVARNFSQIDSITGLKRRLRSQGAQVYDQFNQYSLRFQSLFGLRSEKAMELFNQTVMIKEIRRLTDFVRDHMLERTDARNKIRTVIEGYEHLTRAHDALRKAENQLALLSPLMIDIEKYRQTISDLEQTEATSKALPLFFAAQRHALLAADITHQEQQLQISASLADACGKTLDELRRQDTELAVAIGSDAVGGQLQSLTQEIGYANAELQRRKAQAQQYDSAARLLSLPVYNDEGTFYAARQQADALLPTLSERLHTLDAERDQLTIDQHRLQAEIETQAQELDSLAQRQNQIPEQNLRLRRQILDALGIAETDMPFVGELLRVKEQEQIWEGAIERLLHSFGLRLLAPERHYQAVSRYVNRTNLRGRLVFERIFPNVPYRSTRNDHPTLVQHKLEINPDSEYYDWIRQQLSLHYDYLCCADMQAFDRASKAITVTGLQKSSESRHEKDDRFEIGDRRRYILGWDNAAKQEALRQELSQLREQQATLAARLQRVLAGLRELMVQQQRLQTFLEQFREFAALDWRSTQVRFTALETQKRSLEASSDKLQELHAQRHKVQEQIDAAKRRSDQLSTDVARCRVILESHHAALADCAATLAKGDSLLLDQHGSALAARLPAEPLTLGNIVTHRELMETQLREQHDSLERRRIHFNTALISAMSRYKLMYPEETTELDASPQSADDFAHEYERIQQDDLPRFRARFKSLLNEKVVESIVLLKADLENYEAEIKRSIVALNSALRTINYTADTYIKLQSETNPDPEVREFRAELRACLPDVGSTPGNNEAYYEASFQRIQKLINRFTDDVRWTDKVTDVRQWLNFAAAECYRSDDKLKEFYSDSAGKSGGQKAKLAYTILASALAYQYGLKGEGANEHGFRFVVIDEAFSRSDQENSRYAMLLFQELDLQLLVVTPMTGIAVVEPFIAACHFVHNNADGNNSQVETITVEQLRVQRQTNEETQAPAGR